MRLYKRDMMKNLKITIYIGISFILAILIPAVILGILAFRAISHEEAYIEKQLSATFLAETEYERTIIINELERIETMLFETINPEGTGVSRSLIEKWQSQSELIDVSFVLSHDFEILLPGLDAGISADELKFINWNKDFLRGETSIPFYENIVIAYKDEIKQSQQMSQKNNDLLNSISAENDLPEQADYSENEYSAKQDRKWNDRQKQSKSTDRNSKQDQQINNDYELNQMMIEFESNRALKKEVYEKAEKSGKKVSTRKVFEKFPENTIQSNKKSHENNNNKKSIFVSQLLNIQEITANSSSGIIPRLIYDELNHLFWKKLEDGKIIGCIINKQELEKKLLSALDNPLTSERLMTLLDENGTPLVEKDSRYKYDFSVSSPFVSKEIHQLLPRWEIAVFLNNPDMIKEKADYMKYLLLIVIIVLFTFIILGSVIILKMTYSEIKAAQQKTTFVANVSHELKTPLTSIRMFAEILKEKRQPDETKQKNYLSIMVSETERLTRLINNVLDFSKMKENKKKYQFRTIEITGLVTAVFESQKMRLHNQGFTFHLINPFQQLLISGDEEAIKQVLLNLLSNAEKYSVQQKDIELEIKTGPSSVSISVSDRGIGIANKYSKKIFKNFFRIDDSITNNIKGTGLGLSISQNIMKEHRGTITHEPRPGGGSVFIIQFPLIGENQETDYEA